MALTYDQLNSVSTPDFDMGQWTDQVYKKNVILDRIREGMRGCRWWNQIQPHD